MVIKSFLLLRWRGMSGGDLGFKYVVGLTCASVCFLVEAGVVSFEYSLLLR